MGNDLGNITIHPFAIVIARRTSVYNPFSTVPLYICVERCKPVQSKPAQMKQVSEQTEQSDLEAAFIRHTTLNGATNRFI